MSDNNLYEFNLFCGLHYTSDSDIYKNGDMLDSVEAKSFIMATYMNYFLTIAYQMFKMHNVPKTIDENFVKRTLINRGSIAVVNDNSLGLIAQPFTTTGKFNMYEQPTEIQLSSIGNSAIVEGLTNRVINNPDDFEILKLNPMAIPLYNTIYFFCNKITETQRSIDVNVFNNQAPLVVECTKDQQTTVALALRKWGQQLKHIILNKSTGVRAEDLFGAKDIGAQWKASQMVEVMQYYKSEFFTMLGINNIPYEKRGNLITAETKSSNHIVGLTINSMLDTMNECCKRINEKFNTDMYFTYAVDDVNDISTPTVADQQLTAGVITEQEHEQKEQEEIDDYTKVGE